VISPFPISVSPSAIVSPRGERQAATARMVARLAFLREPPTVQVDERSVRIDLDEVRTPEAQGPGARDGKKGSRDVMAIQRPLVFKRSPQRRRGKTGRTKKTGEWWEGSRKAAKAQKDRRRGSHTKPPRAQRRLGNMDGQDWGRRNGSKRPCLSDG
jgi:hypothetical protein